MASRLRVASLACLWTVVTVGAEASAQASFTPIGDLPGGAFESYATDVSDDGAVVVGHSRVGTFSSEPFVWDATNGLVGIGDLPGGNANGRAFSVSGDGTTVVGQSDDGRDVPFSWTSGGGMVPLGGFPGEMTRGGTANGVSSDGSVTTGYSVRSTGSPTLNWEAFRRDGGGMVGLGFLGTGSRSFANDISRDGEIVVGFSNLAGGIGEEAFVWDATNGMVGLGALLPGERSNAHGVSDDGSVIVGWSINGMFSGRPVVWSGPGPPTELPPLPGGSGAGTAFGVSADGTLICGRSSAASGFARAFVWSAITGTQELSAVLTQAGVDLTGWTLVEASAISGDGTTVVGYGTNPSGDTEGFVATLPAGFGVPIVPLSGPLGVLGLIVATGLVGRRALRR